MDYHEREVSFYSDGSRIAALLIAPAEQARPGPGLVLCQGINGIGRNYRFPRTARAFARAGYACLLFDYRGFGESEGPPGRLWPEEQLIDIRNALTFLQQQPGVDAQRLGLWGTSFGGAHVVQAAAVDARVRTAVSIVGVGNGERWLRSLHRYWEWRALLRRLEADGERRVIAGRSEIVSLNEVMRPDPATEEARQRSAEISPDAKSPARPPQMTLESVERIIAYRPEDVVHLISPRPVLFVHTEDDQLVPPEESLAMYERAGEPKRLVLFPGHHFTVYLPPLYEQVTQLSLDWLREHLPA